MPLSFKTFPSANIEPSCCIRALANFSVGMVGPGVAGDRG